MKIEILSKEDSAELKEVVEGLKLIREERLKEKETMMGGSKVIRNKREYIRHIFNEAINRIICQKLSTVRVKIADLGNACFEVRHFILKLFQVTLTIFRPSLSTTTSRRTFRRDSTGQWRFYWAQSIIVQQMCGVRLV